LRAGTHRPKNERLRDGRPSALAYNSVQLLK
jgi:hypothetical protein